jgi:hypothetical protein
VRLPEVELSLSPGVVGQWQGDRTDPRRPMLAHPLPHGRLRPLKDMLGMQPLPDPRRRVALLARCGGILLEPALDDVDHWAHDQCHRRHRPPVAHGPGSAIALRTVLQLTWKARAISRTLRPSRRCAQRIRSISTTLVIPPSGGVMALGEMPRGCWPKCTRRVGPMDVSAG